MITTDNRNHRSFGRSALAGLAVVSVATLLAPDGAQAAGQTAAQGAQAIVAATSGQERLRIAAEMAEPGAATVAEMAELLRRPRATSAADRRAALKAISADVPDKKGRFRTPRRKEKINRGDDFDWLASLAKLDAGTAGLGELMADVALIRGLAASRDGAATDAILEFAFSDEGLIYRDECGRYLRKMSPYSLPGLIVLSSDRKKPRSLRRYADYQLDRLDRQDPAKALNQAREDRRLYLDVIAAYGVSKHRGASLELLRLGNHPADDIRAAARKSLMAYLTGPTPKPAPKRKLVLPGGRLSDEEEPLWLNYRELAEVELRRRHEEVFGQKAPRRDSPATLAETLFAHYDTARAEDEAKALARVGTLTEAGSWAEAAELLDRILARNPAHPERADMARVYFEHAAALAQTESWSEAAIAYSKAHGLSPEGGLAGDALASHHYALGKALEAEGKDGSAEFRRAKIATPEGTTLSARGAPAAKARGQRWMLYAGIGGGAGALILLILGLAVRRR